MLFDSAAASREPLWESANSMTSDECVNVVTSMLVATLYNLMVLSQGTATMEKSLASSESSPRLEYEIGVPLLASQNLKSFRVKEASRELSRENLSRQSI